MKVRSLDEFSAALSGIVTWRRHELKNLQSFFRSQKNALPVLMKSALLLTYAHWEGGVKDMAQAYLHHVEQQKRLRRELNPCFLALASIGAIKSAAASKTILPYLQAVDYVLCSHQHRYRLPNIQLVDTESNLSSAVLKNILACIGHSDSWSFFESKQRFIDVALLATRNSIAHTGRSDREETDIEEILGDVLDLLECFKTLLENSAATKKYLA